MKGIDISEHNAYIDFNQVKNNGIDFVIIRIGWIGNKENHTIDKYFEDYYKRAKEANLKIGFYVYSYCKSIEAIKSGANWVLSKLKNKSCELPIFLDLEDNSIINCGKDNLTAQAVSFCNYIENFSEFIGGIYANLNWFTNYLNVDKLITYKIWLAQYTSSNNHSAKFKVDLWQYTSSGKVVGINGNVDLNKCLNCNNINTEEITGEKKGDFEMKIYQNGSTKEDVYQDKNCLTKIGYLNSYETAECYGIIDNKALVVYNVDKTNNKKVGFVRWLGGIK